MATKTEHCHLNKELTFYDPSGPLTVRASDFALTRQDNSFQSCHLTFQVNLETYQRIEQLALFNLKPKVRGPLPHQNFVPESDITAKVELQPNLLPQLAEHATTVEEVAAYLIDLNDKGKVGFTNPHSPLSLGEIPSRSTSHSKSPIFTDNWFCLSVKQQQGEEEIGYRTFWDYANPGTIDQVATLGDRVVEFLVDLFKSAASEMQSERNEMRHLTNFLNELVEVVNREPRREIAATKPSEIMVEFFEEDDWEFVFLEDEILQLAFQGENGRWSCYARAKDEEQQFIFYSVCPVNAPKEQSQIAEFLTKANYGLIIGNFELDFADGEIRYKTSIDVQDDRLTPALIQQLVYTNVSTMDNYLPSIVAVINNQLSVDKAIAQSEG